MTEFEVWTEKRPYLKEIGKLYHEATRCFQKENIGFDAHFTDEHWKALTEKGSYLINNIKEPLAEKGAVLLKSAVCFLKDSESMPDNTKNICGSILDLAEKDENFYKDFIKNIIEAKDDKETSLDSDTFNFAYLLSYMAVSFLMKPSVKDILEKADAFGYTESSCPVCGKEPSMAILKKGTKGRRRRLMCGHCHTEWYYKRIGCPYCKNEDQNSLRILQTDSEPNIRADVCGKCNSYILTNLAESEISKNEWAWLHIDLLCGKESLIKKGSLLSAK